MAVQSLWGTGAACPASFLRGCWEDGPDSGSELVVYRQQLGGQRQGHSICVKQVILLKGPQSCSSNNNKPNRDRYLFLPKKMFGDLLPPAFRGQQSISKRKKESKIQINTSSREFKWKRSFSREMSHSGRCGCAVALPRDLDAHRAAQSQNDNKSTLLIVARCARDTRRGEKERERGRENEGILS